MDKKLNVETLYTAAKHKGIVQVILENFGAGMLIQIPFGQTVCKTDIDELELSVRAFNALKRSGFRTVGDVTDAITQGKLIGIRNLGRKSSAEIKIQILEYGSAHLSEMEQKKFLQKIIGQGERVG